jgi:NOL1/NOP2/sun family putative RNA methylase
MAGHYQVQEASAMLPVLLLGPQPGERVLDLCAAPGMKTAQMALAMRNRGTLVANDPAYSRMRSVRMHVDRLGLLNVSMTIYDGSSYPKAAGMFDAVLADVPCSCEGTSRKTPTVADRVEADRKTIVRKQIAILTSAVRRCRPGGRIVYSTCTYAPEENEAVVDAVVRQMPKAVRIRPVQLKEFQTTPGLADWKGAAYHPDMTQTARIWPHHNDTGGFFMALLEKRDCAPGNNLQSTAISGPDGKTADDLEMAGATENDEDYVDILKVRYGIDATAFSGLRLVSKNKREICIVADDHRPPLKPESATGLPLMHKKMRYPKLTTAGAVQFGQTAGRNVIEVNRSQLADYLSRRPFRLEAGQDRLCDGGGHVLIRHQGTVLGVGNYQRQNQIVESFFPKHLAVDSTTVINSTNPSI